MSQANLGCTEISAQTWDPEMSFSTTAQYKWTHQRAGRVAGNNSLGGLHSRSKRRGPKEGNSLQNHRRTQITTLRRQVAHNKPGAGADPSQTKRGTAGGWNSQQDTSQLEALRTFAELNRHPLYNSATNRLGWPSNQQQASKIHRGTDIK